MTTFAPLRTIALSVLGAIVGTMLTFAPASAAGGGTAIVPMCNETSFAGTTAVADGGPSAAAQQCSGSDVAPIKVDPIPEKSDGIQTGVHWWGYQWLFSNAQTNTMIAYANGASGVTGLASALCGGTIAGVVPCTIGYAVAAAVIVVGGSVLSYCNRYGRGIKLNYYWNGWMSCGTR